MIERMIAEGKTEEEIIAFLVAQCNMPQEEAEFMYDIVVGRIEGDVVAVSADEASSNSLTID